jgi:hypothetical protein
MQRPVEDVGVDVEVVGRGGGWEEMGVEGRCVAWPCPSPHPSNSSTWNWITGAPPPAPAPLGLHNTRFNLGLDHRTTPIASAALGPYDLTAATASVQPTPSPRTSCTMSPTTTSRRLRAASGRSDVRWVKSSLRVRVHAGSCVHMPAAPADAAGSPRPATGTPPSMQTPHPTAQPFIFLQVQLALHAAS